MYVIVRSTTSALNTTLVKSCQGKGSSIVWYCIVLSCVVLYFAKLCYTGSRYFYISWRFKNHQEISATWRLYSHLKKGVTIRKLLPQRFG